MSHTQKDVTLMAADIVAIDFDDDERIRGYRAGALTMLANDDSDSDVLKAQMRLMLGYETIARSMLKSLADLTGYPREELLRQFREEIRSQPE